MPISIEAAIEIAGRSRGNIQTNALLRRVRDFAQIKECTIIELAMP
jgi:Holliday junction resolvasome RuvABC ATP-dependent DNA helicase subunit